MFFHARNTNMETTQLSHSSSESLKSATMIQLFPQKSLFSIKSLVQCREGGCGAILRYRSFLHSDPGAMRVIDTIRRDIPALFGHLLLVWHFVWLQKNTKLIQSFLETRIFRFHLRVVTSLFCVLFFIYCLLLGRIPLFDVPFIRFFTRLG